MTYRAPLLDQDNKLNDHFQALTYSQFAKFGMWSIETGKPVSELMQGWMIWHAEHDSHMEGHDIYFLEGMLPCGLYGGMDHTGRTHT